MSRQDANAAFALTSFLYGANAPYIEDLYARFETDPKKYDEEVEGYHIHVGGGSGAEQRLGREIFPSAAILFTFCFVRPVMSTSSTSVTRVFLVSFAIRSPYIRTNTMKFPRPKDAFNLRLREPALVFIASKDPRNRWPWCPWCP